MNKHFFFSVFFTRIFLYRERIIILAVLRVSHLILIPLRSIAFHRHFSSFDITRKTFFAFLCSCLRGIDDDDVEKRKMKKSSVFENWERGREVDGGGGEREKERDFPHYFLSFQEALLSPSTAANLLTFITRQRASIMLRLTKHQPWEAAKETHKKGSPTL